MDKYCPHCGSTGRPVRITKGSLLVEIIAWLCFLLPGLLYSLWRLSSRYEACRTCRQAGIIPVGSPKAIADLGVDGAQSVLEGSPGYKAGRAVGNVLRRVLTDIPAPARTDLMCPDCNISVRLNRPICPQCGQRVRISRPA